MRRRKNTKKKIILTAVFLIILWILGFYLYITYNNIEIKSSNYETQKTLSTESNQTVQNIEENSTKIADIIEETTKGVCRNIKIKKCRRLNFRNKQ